ncbi:hypothetical protein SETIT_6G110700v2 [Setaria italica]|nr:hypothetical protein SETIT_6G110700v2 [Setaria italica]
MDLKQPKRKNTRQEYSCSKFANEATSWRQNKEQPLGHLRSINSTVKQLIISLVSHSSYLCIFFYSIPNIIPCCS